MTVGQRFRWSALDGTASGFAVVVDVRSSRQEGMSPEVEQYAARWLDALPLAGEDRGALTFVLGTDGCVYLNGSLVTITTE